MIEAVPGPTISLTDPQTCLSPEGNQRITLTGTNLRKGSVTVNGIAATIIGDPTDTTLVFKTPPGPAGTWAEVIVTTGFGTDQTWLFYQWATPTITPGGPITLCWGDRVTLRASSTVNVWFVNDSLLLGPDQTCVVVESGNYSVKEVGNRCASAASNTVVVTVNPLPTTPTATPEGATTFCQGGSVTLSSNSATGNQWFESGNRIDGATTQKYVVSASGSYTVKVTVNGCPSAASAAVAVTVKPLPVTPTVTPEGATTFCQGGSVTLNSSSATGNEWFESGNRIDGATNQKYVASASGRFTVKVTSNGCTSPASPAVVVTLNPVPATPAATPDGATTFWQGGSVTLSSSSATGNQWFESGNRIDGATNQRYVVSASGSYTVKVTVNGCPSAASPAVPVTVSPLPAAPAATADGATTFCQGGTVTLSSSRATGNEWFESGNRIDGATNQRYVVSASGSYTVKVTEGNGFTSAASNAVAVTVNPNPNATITAPPTVTANATGFPASVANAGEGANYEWMITNGTITAGTDPTNITFTSGTVGTLTLRCTVTTSAGCQDSRPANVNVVPQPLMPMFDAAIACRAGGFDSDMCAKFLLGAYPGTTALQMATVLSLAWAGIMNNRLLEDSLLEGEYSPNDVASAVKETLHLDWRTNATYPNSRLPNVSKVHALYQGDLANLSAGEMVDFLVVSALPGDYTPTPGSLIGALAARGVSVQQLSENPAANYPQFHCWVSSPIAGQNFNQLIVFESTGAEAPANIPGILSTLQAYWPNPHAGSNYPFATIAQPLVSTGRAGANPDAVLTALFQSAASVLPGNYGLGCVMTVVYDRSQADAMTQLFNSLAGK